MHSYKHTCMRPQIISHTRTHTHTHTTSLTGDNGFWDTHAHTHTLAHAFICIRTHTDSLTGNNGLWETVLISHFQICTATLNLSRHYPEELYMRTQISKSVRADIKSKSLQASLATLQSSWLCLCVAISGKQDQAPI